MDACGTTDTCNNSGGVHDCTTNDLDGLYERNPKGLFTRRKIMLRNSCRFLRVLRGNT